MGGSSGARGRGEPADDELADHGAQVILGRALGEVHVEQESERVLVRDLEDAVGTDDDVHVECIDVGPEDPGVAAVGQFRFLRGRNQSP